MFESFFHAILENPFLQNALMAITLISIISGIIGSLLVSNKIVFVGGGVAHCAYAGIGIALFYGFSLLLGSIISALFVAFSLAIVKKKFENHIDTFSAILWALGMSVGVIFINLTPNANADIESYLFGSLISVDSHLLWIIFLFNVILCSFIALYYNEILSISYDYEFCELKGLKVNLFMNIIFAFIAIGVILSMQISGLILVLAMLSIPAYISNTFAKTLKTQMFFSSFLSCTFMVVGLFFAYQYNMSPGAMITLVGVICTLIIFCLRYIINIFYKG
ncbi:hypothetical protein CQA53_00735 [Helicobacter didelphidarum]|uniref:Metal ABC transporter permease n=2 Tax=Helicobacter didelphidarum TaxID=2040648 RepID=A0A3D8IR72_9HELI|nr:hypothetical protein CQA53_00735 [Helicobacter didelphidarum]